MSKQAMRHRRIPLRRPHVRAAINARELFAERLTYRAEADK